MLITTDEIKLIQTRLTKYSHTSHPQGQSAFSLSLYNLIT